MNMTEAGILNMMGRWFGQVRSGQVRSGEARLGKVKLGYFIKHSEAPKTERPKSGLLASRFWHKAEPFLKFVNTKWPRLIPILAFFDIKPKASQTSEITLKRTV